MSELETEVSEARRVIYSVEKRESSYETSRRALENLYGQGFVYEYHSGDNRPYERGERYPKVKNRRAVIDDYIREQNRVRNDSEGKANQSVTPSIKCQSSVSEDASNYILDTKEYKEAMKLDQKAIDRFAGRLLSKSQSQYSREQLTERLSALFDYIANGGNSHKKWTCSYNLTKKLSEVKMSKSKFNYKVYNGKALKKVFENSKIFVLSAIFAVGIIIGAATINGDSSVVTKAADIAENFIASRAQQGITDNFLNSIFINIGLMFVNLFLAFSLIGYPFIIWLPFIRGMGIGIITGYLYSSYKITGLGYCILTVYPAAIVSTVAFILACNDSCDYSKNAFSKAIGGRGQFEKDETKIFLIRQAILTGVCVLSSIVDAVFTSAFSGFFEI